MLKIWIKYKIIIRKLYNKRIKGWNTSADGLSFLMLVMHFLTFFLFIEAVFNIKGFTYFSLNYNIPLAPAGALVFIIFYTLFTFFFSFKWEKKNISMIRQSFNEMKYLSKKKSVYFLVISIFLFLMSLFLNIILK